MDLFHMLYVIHAFLNPGHLPPLSPIGILWYVAGTIASLMFGSTVLVIVCQLLQWCVSCRIPVFVQS